MENHRLRYMTVSAGNIRPANDITDSELDEVLLRLPEMDEYEYEYEYSGNFIVTKDGQLFQDHCDNMCCGQIEKDILLKDGTTIHFAFDYGH